MARLFDEGRFLEAAALFDENSRAQVPKLDESFLRARLYLREAHMEHRAISLLNGVKTSKQNRDFVEREMLLGEAYAVAEARAFTKDFRAADERFKAAMSAATDIADPELLAQVAYRLGRRHAVAANEPQKAREALALARGGSSLESRLDAQHLESWILSREGRVRDQARILSELLRSIDPNSPRHMEHRARATQTLAAIAREAFLPEAIPLVERHLGGVPWPDDFRVARFQATKAIAWAKALQGDYFNAFRYLKQSATVAPDDAWRAVALSDRAYLAHVRGEQTWFRQELSDAQEAAEAADWIRREDESPVALLLLAELLAPFNAAEASGYLTQFRALGEIQNSRSLLRDDERFQALVDYSTGVVDMHLGNRKLAVSRLQSAMRTYERVGFEWRAARAALRLFDATKKNSFLTLAEGWLRHYPASWLVDELRARRTSKAVETGLSPMRDRVFRLLCEGKSNIEIAAQLGLSVSTIANHAKAVLSAFDVRSRHALVAEAMRRGIIQPAGPEAPR